MKIAPRDRWTREIRPLILCAVMIRFPPSHTIAQEPDRLQQLQQDLQTLKQQLQKEAEATAKPKKATVSAVELAAQEAAKKAVADVWVRYQIHLPSEPTYEYLNEADRKVSDLQEQVKSFEFPGYLRSGYGLNSTGASR